ncbi:MAG: bifunctional folylpolyglutamate synthase/dihydrofolate synthase, partial [Bacteroidales bacterium]
HKEEFDAIQPSFFEWTFALAAWYFAKEKVDIAIIETGMGGRLDSTNVITSVVSVITNIGLDHTQFLGTTLEAIATEKAGIIKAGIPVVIGETQKETSPVFDKTCREQNSEISYADQQILLKETAYTQQNPPMLGATFYSLQNALYYNLLSPLSGKYQLKNMATVLKTIEAVQRSGFNIGENCIEDGILNVVKNTGLMGRWQTIKRHPLTIADIGHNPDGIREVLEQIAITPHEKLHFVLGVVNDKDVKSMLNQLPQNAVYYFCKANIPRGLDAAELAKLAHEIGIEGESFASVKEALASAQQSADSNDLVLVGGSAFVVAEVV